ncbi:tRNA epoxyqueuosine(34) reductase QueG [Kyrpidia tusciae]|uniref:4Fe-4S ferredoxin iron-sulfur binding domain protein n=1 Tax=Kyrpidia tusciae (strain DSM 2912 / NBRC 15312 / T2) TaxID=562970 RepID=D5WR20_KYRT2|nr:tRNA epoxyqueuosine(34) reductase QueG [Kyrpidia tusciae]ADG06750.1 4Fe-4S ferredoxin iron-sulfur binding domain protein [Kyrpidia tusciae DSM 2912]
MFGPVESAAVTLQQDAEARGFLAAWAPVDLPPSVVDRYRAWIADRRQAGMGQLARNVEVRLAPRSRLAWARSVLVLAAPHRFPDPGPPPGGVRIGRVGRIFWMREQDYIQRRVQPHLDELKEICHRLGGRCRDYVEQGPLSFRSYGAGAGLGWIGRNGMLLHPEWGSYMTLAVLLTDFEVEAAPEHPFRCGRCRRCLDRCPTGALLGDGTLDANRCISYWTTQHLDLIPPEVWDGLGSWLFGCDECQEVCPWTPEAERFWEGYEPEPELAHPDLSDFLTLPIHMFAQKYAQSAFERAGRPRMARNALIVLGNTRDSAYLPLIRMGCEDPSPLVRATASWAAVRVGGRQEAERLLRDPEPLVCNEARRALEFS